MTADERRKRIQEILDKHNEVAAALRLMMALLNDM
jgi:hypothetical protein